MEAITTPQYLGIAGSRGIYYLSLGALGVSSIRSITIEDDDIISGGTGAASGFDLDWITLSTTLITDPSQVHTLPGLDLFTFTEASVAFEPGWLRPWNGKGGPELNQTQLIGTSGSQINFQQASFDQLGGNISLGEGGKIRFALNQAVSPDNLYLYFADAASGNDNSRVRISSTVQTLDPGLTLEGTTEDDQIDLTQGNEQNSGQGNDQVNGNAGNDLIATGAGDDRGDGGIDNDTLIGGAGNDSLLGSDGDDWLVGSQGDDWLDGGAGYDTLIGGLGADHLVGGTEADRFVFSGTTRRAALQNSTLRSRDRITDFQVSQGDRFQLDFDNSLSTTELPSSLFQAGQHKGNLRSIVRQVYGDYNHQRPGQQSLRPNGALFFSIGSKTFLSINNGKRGFSPQHDLLVNVTGMALDPADSSPGRLQVSTYFL